MRARLSFILALACVIVIGTLSIGQQTTDRFADKKVGFISTNSFEKKPPNWEDFLLPDTSIHILSPSHCKNHTVLNVVAHQDDDLLFINPAISDAIAAGKCVRTLYVTAGNGAQGKNYMQNREDGAIAAYNIMLGGDAAWYYKKEVMSETLSILTAAPVNNDSVSLIFLRLPDGNLDGNGFAGTKGSSIQKLWSGKISSISPIDSKISLTRTELLQKLTTIMRAYQPTVINSQTADSPGGDHSDHRTTGLLTMVAVRRYVSSQAQHRVITNYFVGYPSRTMPANLSEQQAQLKHDIFFAYALRDPAICRPVEYCHEHGVGTYQQFMDRQYSQPKALRRP